jgi:small subunit ribosomal protein S21
MAEVILQKDEPLEKALKRFRKKCEQSGILSEIKKRAHYEKPSEKRKKKLAEARRKMRKKMLRDKRYMG